MKRRNLENPIKHETGHVGAAKIRGDAILSSHRPPQITTNGSRMLSKPHRGRFSIVRKRPV
jgi:hypothetical protein